MNERARIGVGPAALSRRHLLQGAVGAAAVTAASAVLAACGDTAVPTATSAPAATKTSATVAPAAASPAAPSAAPATMAAAPATVASAAVSATTAPSAMTAPSAASAPSMAASGGAPTATAVPVAAADGKIASGVVGVPDAYIKYPPLFKTVNTIPGKGGKVTIFKASQLPPPTPKDQNPYWQELDKRLGVVTDYNLATVSGYKEKFTALAAGGDFADITLLWPVLSPDQYKLIQQGAFTDLTPYLTGDALKAYPNLSKYPDYAWKNSLIRNKLYWVPRMNFLWGGNELMYRRDWAEKLGIPQPKNVDEFFNLMVAMTKNDPDGNGKADTWGLGGFNNEPNTAWSMGFLKGMFRTANNWRKNPDGTLTKDLETDEFKQALTFAKKLYDAGAYHPDTATWTQTQAQDAMISGKYGAKGDSITQLIGAVEERLKIKQQNPAADLRMLVPPGFDGGKGTTFNQSGVPYSNGIPAKVGKDPERVKELLRVLDYYGALYGSEEYTFLNFGIKDRDHTINATGSPVLNDTGRAEVNELGNIVFPPRVYYFPSAPPEDTIYLQNVTKDAIAEGVDDPTLNLYSATFVSKAGELNQLILDRQAAIITGRDPLSALDTFIKDWRSRGGDMIRKEFEAELKAQ